MTLQKTPNPNGGAARAKPVRAGGAATARGRRAMREGVDAPGEGHRGCRDSRGRDSMPELSISAVLHAIMNTQLQRIAAALGKLGSRELSGLRVAAERSPNIVP